MYGSIPANQFNIDLFLDTISVLNRTVKDGYHFTPYELFTGETIDYERGFRCRWGDLVIVKKPKGISSDLGVTGEWAMVVRRSMNRTGVLKVYLIGTRRYAYRLHFKRAKVPDWVITATQPSVLKTRPKKLRTLELGTSVNLIQGTQMKLCREHGTGLGGRTG